MENMGGKKGKIKKLNFDQREKKIQNKKKLLLPFKSDKRVIIGVQILHVISTFVHKNQ